MGRDSLFGEKIIWIGRPKSVETPPIFRWAAILLFIVAAASVSFAVAATLALDVAPTSLMVFAVWSVALGAACIYGPRLWLSKVRYIVTAEHVICQRGPFRRTIERRSISFARIFWSKKRPGIGDMELVRAVPTGVLRRRLMLRLQGLAAPDRVWAIIRGVSMTAPSGTGERPLTQRLDNDERVVWSARPRPTARAWLPHGRREISMLGLSLLLFAVLGRMLLTAIPNMAELLAAGLPASSFVFATLLIGQALGAGVVGAAAGYFFYDAIVRPARLVKVTRYLITNRRVLIQRGSEELHLDRPKIVDVIDAPRGDGLSDVFLVLDGPRARALAASGAFGEQERGPQLRPVLESVEDAESVSRILRTSQPPDEPPMSEAA